MAEVCDLRLILVMVYVNPQRRKLRIVGGGGGLQLSAGPRASHRKVAGSIFMFSLPKSTSIDLLDYYFFFRVLSSSFS